MTNIPDYLYSLPKNVLLPVQTKIQELPFKSLSWEDFERLTLRYVERSGELEYCHLYGTRGQKQEGIDLFARHELDEFYTVYQCKRYQKYTVSDIQSAISTFLKGEWVKKCKRFYICTSCDLSDKKLSDEIEKQSILLKQYNIKLLVLDEIKFSAVLKEHPQIVYDFFGLEWARQFCGEEKLEQINNRITTSDFKLYKKKLGKFYSTLFENHEGSINNLSGENSAPKFEERYIPPDIVNNTILESEKPGGSSNMASSHKYGSDISVDFIDELDHGLEEHNKYQLSAFEQDMNIESRLSAVDWISSEKNTVVIGGPGSGKSALLKYIILGLLEQVEVKNKNLLQNRNKLIPVWLPFGYWSSFLEKNPSSSMIECMQAWFRGMDHVDLWPLIETAINDDRLLIVVDGLDEWSSEQSALICLQKLTVFIQEKEASSILSSRPSGMERLGNSVQNWPKGHLVGLTKEQQKQLITTCTEYRLKKQINSGDELLLKHEVNKTTQDLISEISRSKDLFDLASVPLLMYMLIHLKAKSISLPHSRFQVYKALVSDLVKMQPQRRRTAAQVISQSNELSERELINILSRFAFDIQMEFPHGNAPIDIAEKLITNHLSDQSKEFAFNRREALRHTEKFINIGESEVGILVKKSPEEIGFFHRTLQEFLAAQYISTEPTQQQELLLSEYIFNGQWKDVLIGMFSLLQRPSDVEDLIQYIKSLKFDLHKNMSREAFLAEIAFGDNRCSANTAKIIANETFRVIEEGKYLPHRERLLNIALAGYSSNKLHDGIVYQLKDWSPLNRTWFSSLFMQISEHWEADEITLNALFYGLELEDFFNKQAAAKVIVNKFSSNQKALIRLVKLAKTSLDLDTRLCATGAIISGWANSKEAKTIYNNLSETIEPTARLLRVYYETLSGKVNDANRDLLLEFSLMQAPIKYDWQDLIIECLKLEYIDKDLKLICLNRVFKGEECTREIIGLDIALEILFTYFYNDSEFIDYFIEDLKEKHPKSLSSFRRGHAQAKELELIIEHSQRAYDAVEDWVINEPYFSYFAYDLFKTERMKKHLLSLMGEEDKLLFWPAGALLTNWGIEDVLIKEAIFKVIDGPVEKASELAHFYPKIFSDKKTCVQKLVELLKTPGKKRYDFIIKGIVEVANEEQYDEVVKVLFEQSGEMPPEAFDEALILLFGVNNKTPEIIALADKNLKKRDGNIGLVAAVFCKDDEFRKKILRKIKVLPSKLRLTIASKLSEINTEQSSWELLADYDNEVNASVKTTLAIGYYSSPLTSINEEVINGHIQRLKDELYATGFDHKERRVAAFCGVLALEKLDIMKGLTDSYQKDKRYSISLESSYQATDIYFSYLAKKWDYIKATFGQQTYNLFNIEEDKLGALCSCLGPHIEDKSDLKREFKDSLYKSDLNMNERVLIAASRIIPKEELLFKMCFYGLGLYSEEQRKKKIPYRNHPDSLLALYILEQQFFNDDRAKSYLLEIHEINKEQEDVLLATAYAIGFNDAPFVEKAKLDLKNKPMWLPTYFRCIADTRGHKKKIDFMLRTIEPLGNAPKQYSKYFSNVISNLINSSDNLYKEMIKSIKTEKLIQNKLHLLILLANSKGLNSTIKTIAIEIDNKQRKKRYPDLIFDVGQGSFSTTILTLNNILYND